MNSVISLTLILKSLAINCTCHVTNDCPEDSHTHTPLDTYTHYYDFSFHQVIVANSQGHLTVTGVPRSTQTTGEK